jgi:hypothetical protein
VFLIDFFLLLSTFFYEFFQDDEVDQDQFEEVNPGITSAPLQSPQDLCRASMTRSRSLNSPLATSCLPELGTSRNKRRHSGEGLGGASSSASSASMMSAADPLVNMELCGARLSQREALVFDVPGYGSSSSSVHRAMLKLRMLDRCTVAVENNLGAPAAGDLDLQDALQNTMDVVEKTMIWTELEACKRQVSQIGVSACGATAVINVLQVILLKIWLLRGLDFVKKLYIF